MNKLLATTMGDLADALELYIKTVENPNTPDKWTKFFSWMEARGTAKHIADIPDNITSGYLAGSLRDEGVNAHVFKKSTFKGQ